MASSNDGLTAWKALDLLYPEQPRDPEVRSDAQLFAGGVTWIDAEYDRREGFEDLSEFEGLLEDGTWYATGYRSGSDERERIPADLWTVLSFNRDGDSASGNDLEYSGLRFYEYKPEPKKTASSEAECLKYLAELMKARKTPQQRKEDCRTKALQQDQGLTGKAFDRAWKKAVAKPTTDKTWRKPGPVDNS